MEKNHLPSSPLQHCHPSSSRTSKPSASETNESKRLSVPRPSNPHASPPVATASLNSWSQQEMQLDERWISQPTAWTKEGSSTKAMTSSNSGPSPPILAVMTSTAIHHPSTRLLTSEPLNRSTSQHASSSFPSRSPSPPFTPPLKRRRAASLPAATDTLKRHKSRHHILDSSDLRHRPNEPRQSGPSRCQLQRERAEAFVAQPFAERKSRTASPFSGEQIVVAAKEPPINVNSLRSLDVAEILKIPQLCHDLLFDSLAFRPISCAASFPPTYAEVFSPSKYPSVDPKTSNIVADMYWESIAEELASGCRCTRWRVSGGTGKVVDAAFLEKRERVMRCLCGKWRPELNEAEWWESQSSPGWQSRLPELVKTLREILISLMGSTTPCTNHFAHSFSRNAVDPHEVTCPTVTHALVPELYAALDPDFLTIKVRRGIFGLSLFQVMGEAMKVHCAPVRDNMVDDMVRTAMSGNVALVLRKCFDCVEVMKLDVCNHQIHAVRPYLWGSANACELSAFHSFLTQSHLKLETSITRIWLRNASRRILASTQPSERKALIIRRDQLAMRSLVDGFVDLVFCDWNSGDEAWPPFAERRLLGPGAAQSVEGLVRGSVEIPESFRMDARRIKEFHAEVVELVITSMLLLATRALLKTSGTFSPSRLAGAKSDLEDRDAQPDWVAADLAFRLAMRVHRPDSLELGEIWETSREEMVKIKKTVQTIDIFITTSVNRQAPLFASLLKKLRGVVTKMLTNHLLADVSDRVSDRYDGSFAALTSREVDTRIPAPARARERHASAVLEARKEEERMLRSTGLEVVEGELRDLVRRMEKIVGLHAGAFKEVYTGRGMLVGS